MFGIGGFEFFLILLFAFLIVGPDRLPEFAKKAGKFVARFREAKTEMDKVIKTEVYDAKADDPFQQPIDALKKMSDQVENAKSGETFSQRKARYDAERAAERKAAQRAQQEAERQAAAATAAQAAQGAVEAPAQTAVPATAEAPATPVEPFDPAELYAAQPIAPVSGSAAAPSQAQADPASGKGV